MNGHRPRGTTLVVGLMLLAVVTLLGLAGAGGARVELQLALNEQFRENAASAASAGIEYAISRIVSTSHAENNSAAAPESASASLTGSTDHFETVTRFVGYEAALSQAAGTRTAGAHFEITSTGHSARRAIDRQRAEIVLVVNAPSAAQTSDCAPIVAGIHCHQLGELVRLSWQRLPSP
jgi:Tfp pilus assembly protein PilX